MWFMLQIEDFSDLDNHWASWVMDIKATLFTQYIVLHYKQNW